MAEKLGKGFLLKSLLAFLEVRINIPVDCIFSCQRLVCYGSSHASEPVFCVDSVSLGEIPFKFLISSLLLLSFGPS